MAKLGICVYPHLTSSDKIISTIEKARCYGYVDVFTSLLPNNNIIDDHVSDNFFMLCQYCKENGINVHVDISNKSMEKLVTSYDDLQYFADLGITSLRLSYGFNDEEITKLTNNTNNILICDNTSLCENITQRITTVKENGNIDNFMTMHNFYIRPDTGLNIKYAINKSLLYKKHGIKCGIFINSNECDNILFPQGKGIVTIEKHRNLPSFINMSELIANKIFDYIFIADYGVENLELKIISTINRTNTLLIPIKFYDNIDEEIIKTILETTFISHIDQAENVIRFDQLRQIVKMEPLNNDLTIQKYQVTIDNTNTNQFVGELQIALNELSSKDYVNLIGEIDSGAYHLLEYIKFGANKFKFISTIDL